MSEQDYDNWVIAKNEYEITCYHPLCHQLHERFGEPTERWFNEASGKWQYWEHRPKEYDWIIYDERNGERQLDSTYYGTKKEAKQAIEKHIQREQQKEVK